MSPGRARKTSTVSARGVDRNSSSSPSVTTPLARESRAHEVRSPFADLSLDFVGRAQLARKATLHEAGQLCVSGKA